MGKKMKKIMKKAKKGGLFEEIADDLTDIVKKASKKIKK